MLRTTRILVLGLAVVLWASTALSRPRVAVVIGANDSEWLKDKDGYEKLSFADDDAIKAARLFQAAGVETFLVALPDPDTLTRYPEYRGSSLPQPTIQVVLDTIDKALKRAQVLSAQSDAAELIFYYSGHGGNG